MKVVWFINVAIQMVDSIINENKRSFFGGSWLDVFLYNCPIFNFIRIEHQIFLNCFYGGVQ